MPQDLYDSAGNKIEVPTEDELETQQEEIRQQARKDAESDFSSKLEEKETEANELKEQLGKAEQKDINFSKMREKTGDDKAKQEENLNEIETLKKDIAERDASMKDFVVGGTKNDAMKSYVGDDSELLETLSENYAKIAGPEDTKEQIQAKVTEAFGMLQAQTGVNIDVDVSGGGGGKAVGGGKSSFGGKEVSQDAKDMAAKNMGLSDQDIDTYLK